MSQDYTLKLFLFLSIKLCWT